MKEFPITVGGAPHLVKLYDTAGQEAYDQLRQTFYKDADCFLICFSVDNRTSYNNVIPFWMKELPASVKHVPIVLCGECLLKRLDRSFIINKICSAATKIDKRSTNTQCVTEQEGRNLCEQIGALEYVECSAKTNAGVPNAITTAVRTAIQSQQEPVQKENKTSKSTPTQRRTSEGDSKKKKYCCGLM